MRTQIVAPILGAVLAAAPIGTRQLASAQVGATAQAQATQQDYQQMLGQLGIRKLRPGPSGEENAPNHANYDESKANPYPHWPDPLVMDGGGRVSSARMWRRLRRPQIVKAFEEQVYGRVPANVRGVTWSVTASEAERIGSVSVTATRFIGHVDNSADPAITVDIPMMLVKPVSHRGPMPVLIMFVLGPPAFPAPVPPSPEVVARMNAALRASLIRQDASLADFFRTHPAWQPIPTPPFFPPPRRPDDPIQQLVTDGWAVAMIDPDSIQPDNGAGLTRGVIGLTNKGAWRKPDDWGALRAWAWGASRVYDYLSTDPDLDSKHIGIEGVSRYGKAALVTLAFDQRFYMGLIGSSGEGGAAPFRRNFGETLENLTAAGEYHWMAGNFLKYGASEARSGAATAADLPVESSELIALCAPRLTFISYGSPKAGDALWVDQQGSYMAAVAAGRVFRLLGAKDLGVGDDYQHAVLPPIGDGLLDGELAWRQHSSGHTDVPNVKYFIAWADRWMHRSPPGP
jgi:(4-O-methyl)-D-glucuronate---lignin esterase